MLSCTTGRKKNRKNRLRAFPNKWNELTSENREMIRRSLRKTKKNKCQFFSTFFLFHVEIPTNVQRCCTRCYEKLIVQVRQYENNNQQIEEEEDDDEEESSKVKSTQVNQTNVNQDEEWTNDDIRTFDEALEKFGDNWSQISEYVHRTEQSCRTFYLKNRKNNEQINDENVKKTTCSTTLHFSFSFKEYR